MQLFKSKEKKEERSGPAAWHNRKVLLTVLKDAIYLQIDAATADRSLTKPLAEATPGLVEAAMASVAREAAVLTRDVPKLREAAQAARKEFVRLGGEHDLAEAAYAEAIQAGEPAAQQQARAEQTRFARSRAEKLMLDKEEAVAGRVKAAEALIERRVREEMARCRDEADRLREKAVGDLIGAIEPKLAAVHAANLSFAHAAPAWEGKHAARVKQLAGL